jgi:hypothetical protein
MIEIHRLGARIGAEIRGVDVKALDDAGFAAIYRAWLDANVVVVPGQDLQIEDFLRYSRRFGVVHPHPSKMTRHPDHPEITLLGVDKFRPDGALDMAVGPRWYSAYEMACQVAQNLMDNRDRDFLANDGALTPAESLALVEALLSGEEPAYMNLIVELLKEGKGLRQILDTIQLASAQLILETGDVNNYSIPQHSYEYCNTLRWFFDTFDHPHRVKLLFVAAAFVCRGAHNQRYMGGNGPIKIEPPRGADGMLQHQLLERLDDALMGLRAFEAVNWTAAYLKTGFDRAPLVETLATAAAKTGNDPHNQELGSCLLEDYAHSTARDRDRLLLAQAKHTAGHRKYGDHLEAYRRFAEAFPLAGRR